MKVLRTKVFCFFFLGTIITADQKEDSMLELRQEGIEGTYPL